MEPVLSGSTPEAEELSFAQIFEKYKGKWVAITVTKRDRNSQPTSGKVVASHVDRYRLRQLVAQMNEVCIFFAGESQYPLFL